MRRASDALVNQSGEEGRGDDELTPLGVERRCGLSGNRLIERAALLLELRDLVADRDKHVPISQELRPVADRIAMAGDDDRSVSHRSNVYFGGLAHPFDVSARRLVDQRINPL